MEKIPSIKPNRFVISPAESQPENVGHFVPRKARDKQEIKRRKQLPAGGLVLREQAKGLQIIKNGLLLSNSLTELDQWSDVAVPATIGASQYHMNGPIMHRYVPLPMLAAHQPKDRPNLDMLLDKTLDDFDRALTYTDILLAARQSASKRKYDQLAVRAARHMTHTALNLACLPLSEITSDPTSDMSNQDVQTAVRRRSLEALKQTGSIALEIGAVPSCAQLADSISPLSVELQKAASDRVDEIYHQASSLAA